MDRNRSSVKRAIRRIVALRKESVDRNYKERPGQKARPKSLSARRAWIEISITRTRIVIGCVALRKESVDRNSRGMNIISSTTVALRKESVDRNSTYVTRLPRCQVALRKESVDRNSVPFRPASHLSKVALRKESVDRNKS